MNFYIWRSPGFYADGYLIYVNSDLEVILNDLLAKRDYNWYYIQGIETEKSKQYFKTYTFNNVVKFEKELEERRSTVLNSNRQTKECYSFHSNASLKDLLDKNWHMFLCKDEHKKIIDSLCINKRSPWFLEPVVQSCNEPFYISTAD